MRTKKTLWHGFDVSAFDEELGLLNEMSEKGWQLQDMRMFYQKYAWDDSAVYRYAIDYQPELSMFEFNQYREEFSEQGWTYVPTRGWSGWYVFRKPYDPSLPEEAYLLYTDEYSFRDMKSRIAIGVNLIGIIYLPDLLALPSISTLLLAMVWLLTVVDRLFRQWKLKKVRRVPKKYRFHLCRYSARVIVLLFALSFTYLLVGNSTQKFMMSGPAVGVQSAEFTVKVPDLYGLKTRMKWPERTATAVTDKPIRYPIFTITDERGRLVDSGVLDPNGERTNEFFRAGTYTLSVDWDAAYAPGEAPSYDGTNYWIDLTYHSSLIPDVPLWAYCAWGFGWLAVFIVVNLVAKKRYGV